MIFKDYFQIKMEFVQNPYVDIHLYKMELEYEVLKIFNLILKKYGLEENRFKIVNYYNDQKSMNCISINLAFENSQSITYYKSLGLFAGITCELSDKLRQEIIDKERILKRKLK